MKLHLLDVSIIVLYLLSTIFIGLWYRHDAILDHIAQYNTMHAAYDRVKHGKQRKYDPVHMRHILRRHMERHVSFDQIPWDKYFNELAQTNKPISQETKTA